MQPRKPLIIEAHEKSKTLPEVDNINSLGNKSLSCNKLPVEVFTYIAEHWNINDIKNLRATCRFFGLRKFDHGDVLYDQLQKKAEEQIFAGGDSSFILKQGQLYMTGANQSGELGLKHELPVKTWQINPYFSDMDIKQVSNCGAHTLVLTHQGLCYGMGEIVFYNPDATDNRLRSEPAPIRLPNNNKIISVAAGYQFFILLDENGKCFGAGNNEFHQLRSYSSRAHTLVEITLPENVKIKRIAASHFTLMLSEEGDCYAMGSNATNQIGVGVKGDKYVAKPTKIDFGGLKIKDISAATHHSIFITEEGDCYGLGYNFYGALGFNPNKIQPYSNRVSVPHKITLPDDVKIKKAIASMSYTMLLTVKGECFVMGSNDSGQLGLPGVEKQYEPVKVNLGNDQKIVDIAAGKGHTLLKTKSGDIYVMGASGVGQFGLGEYAASKFVQPSLLPKLPGKVEMEARKPLALRG